MILGKRDQLLRVLKPEAVELIEKFLKGTSRNTPLGEYQLKGEEIFAKVLEYNTTPNNDNQVEAHNQYVDIQFLLGGKEKIKVYNREDLDIRVNYSAMTDCEFFFPKDDALIATVNLREGFFLVLFPNDAHLAALNPGGESNIVNKIVIKIYEKYFA